MVQADGDAASLHQRALAAPIPRAVDKFHLLPAFLKVRGLVKQHIDSYNFFIDHDIKKIIKANATLTCRSRPEIWLRYVDIYLGAPSYVQQHTPDSEHFTPNFCRLSGLTYASPIIAVVDYRDATATSPIRKKARIGYMPVMLRSRICVLNGKDEAELAKLGECPLDPGGYFIAKGTEKVILIQEQLSKNRIIIDTDSKKRYLL